MNALVSCLCPSHHRIAQLRHAVACFEQQTYEPRELIVLYQSDDTDTRDYLAALENSSVRAIEVPHAPRLTIGALRNLSLEAASGHYVAVWDDDDWHAPTRLAEQLGAIAESGKPACVLHQVILFDRLTQSAYLSVGRTWESSLAAERSIVPPYPDLARGSDTPVIRQMLAANQLAALNRPNLYIYVYHGQNIWSHQHWEENLLPYATLLNDDDTAHIRSLLQSYPD